MKRTSIFLPAVIPAVIIGVMVAPAWAQTPLPVDDGVPAGYPPVPGDSRPGASGGDLPVLDEASAEQAEAAVAGDYPPMQRQGGGMIQEAWNASSPQAGVHRYGACRRCVFKVRTREFMTTTIRLPEGEEIESLELGDPGSFDAQIRGSRIIGLKPLTFGTDTSLIVYTAAGGVYPFYVRAEGFNSEHIPDLLVTIDRAPGMEVMLAPAEPARVPAPSRAAAAPQLPPGALSALAPEAEKPAEQPTDFVREVAFDPGALRGWADYKLKGDRALRPSTIFRDDHFTYIQWEWDGVELPTAYVVIDGFDELVNTRVQGRTFIIESVHPYLSLKSGQKHLCIEYRGT